MNHDFTPLIYCLLIAILTGGCTTVKNELEPNLTAGDRARQFDQEFYRTFNRVTKALQNEGYTIETADSDNGLVYTDYKLASTVGAPISGNPRVKVEAVLKREDNGTRVTLTLRIQQEVAMTGGEPDVVSQSEAKEYYQELFENIAAQVGG